ncbi:13603_t:CDS:1, partial [Racocetra persica]
DPEKNSNSDRKNYQRKNKRTLKKKIMSRTKNINDFWRKTDPSICTNCNYPRLPGHDCLFNSSNPNALKRFIKNQRTKETISPEMTLEEKFRI